MDYNFSQQIISSARWIADVPYLLKAEPKGHNLHENVGMPAVIIYELLYQLGITANYTGYFHTAYAVQLCIENQERLLYVTKWLYPDVAKYYKTNWKAVERNIRTVARIIWERNRPQLEALACKPFPKKPSASQLIAILSYNLLSTPFSCPSSDDPGIHKSLASGSGSDKPLLENHTREYGGRSLNLSNHIASASTEQYSSPRGMKPAAAQSSLTNKLNVARRRL